MPDWIVAVVVAVVAATGGFFTSRYGRVHTLERRMDELEAKDRAFWLYCRQLLDHIWQDKGPPPPSPPAAILEDFDLKGTTDE